MPDFDSGANMNFTEKSDFYKFENLSSLFIVGVKFPFLLPVIKKLINIKCTEIFKIFNLLNIYYEKRIFRISWFSGFRYFLHTGAPHRRTKNFITLI